MRSVNCWDDQIHHEAFRGKIYLVWVWNTEFVNSEKDISHSRGKAVNNFIIETSNEQKNKMFWICLDTETLVETKFKSLSTTWNGSVLGVILNYRSDWSKSRQGHGAFTCFTYFWWNNSTMRNRMAMAVECFIILPTPQAISEKEAMPAFVGCQMIDAVI